MGVRGLTNFIKICSDLFLLDFKLHDSYLIIDGNAVAVCLYNQINCNSCFGGDYDRYDEYVSKFFDDLIKCHIIPIIIVDGAIEEKKLRTLHKRVKEKIKCASISNPVNQAKTNVFPLMLIQVFKNAVKKKNLKLLQSFYEADSDIASLARILNCPILSNDSDFYIFDVMYIPFDTLYYGTVRQGDIFVKICKMYKFDNLTKYYPKINRIMIPIVAILLGNDYIDSSKLENFLDTLHDYSKKFRHVQNKRVQDIDAVFNWLQKENLTSAVQKIFNVVKSKNLLKKMEAILNGYLYISPTIIVFGELSETILNKFECISYKYFEFTYSSEIIIKEHEHNLIRKFLPEYFRLLMPDNEKALYKLVPLWFMKEFMDNKFPSFFIDFIMYQSYLGIVQVEDFSEPTCTNISLKIISVMFRIITSGIIDTSILKYTVRGTSVNIATYELECKNALTDNLPTLNQLPDLSLDEKKKIFDQILGLTYTSLDIFPSRWRLYMGVIKYWVHEAKPVFRTECHVYSLIFAMLYHVVDKGIGFVCRKESNFIKKYGKVDIRSKNGNIKLDPSASMTISNALLNINEKDCVSIMPFFLSNFNLDINLIKNAKKFQIAVVHAFSLLQNALRFSMNLNQLLGCPYENPDVAEVFNGTLLYNIYNNFKRRNDIYLYISTILQNSPSLLQLFISISMSVKTLLPTVFDNKVCVEKKNLIKPKNRKKPKEQQDSCSIEQNNDCCIYESESFYESYDEYFDVNNKFSGLNINLHR